MSFLVLSNSLIDKSEESNLIIRYVGLFSVWCDSQADFGSILAISLLYL